MSFNVWKTILSRKSTFSPLTHLAHVGLLDSCSHTQEVPQNSAYTCEAHKHTNKPHCSEHPSRLCERCCKIQLCQLNQLENRAGQDGYKMVYLVMSRSTSYQLFQNIAWSGLNWWTSYQLFQDIAWAFFSAGNIYYPTIIYTDYMFVFSSHAEIQP